MSIEEEKVEDYDELYACIQSLSMIEKSIITLHLQRNQIQRMAETIGVSENYIAVKIKRIRNKLLNNLKAKS